MPSPIRSQRFTITWFPTEEGYEVLFEELPDFMSYYCAQIEQCPKTQRYHFQGYFETVSLLALGKAIKLVHEYIPGAHVEKSRGSFKQNREYCSKSETAVQNTFHELGKPMKQGERSDWAAVRDMIKEGVSIKDIIEEYPNMMNQIQHLKSYKRCIQETTLRVDLEVYYLWGPPRTGKSRLAAEIAEEKTGKPAYRPLIQGGNIWFEGYEGEEFIIIDDIDISQFKRQELLTLWDIHPLLLSIKGSSAPANFKYICITSNYAPPKDEAFTGRFTFIVHIDKPIYEKKIVEKKPPACLKRLLQ